jgi:type II secretion system protein N
MRHTIFQVLAYILYGLLAFIAFVYMMFPYDLLRQRVIERASQGALQLDIASLSPTFPPGLTLRDVRVAIPQPSAASQVLSLQTLRAWPQWLTLFSPTKGVRFSGQFYDGRIAGDVRYTQRDGATYWESVAQFNDLDVARHHLLQEMQQTKKLTVQGRLSGTASTRLTETGQFEQGDLKFEMKPAIFTPGEASRLLVRKQLPCDNLNATARLTQREWQIEELTCQGDDISIDLRGTFRPRSPWSASLPNLRVALQSESTFQPELNILSQWALQRPLGEDGMVKFGLRGRLDNPRPVR